MTTKEKLLALELLGHAKQAAESIEEGLNIEAAGAIEEGVNIEATLLLAAQYARDGADLSILKTLEYK